ncbi:MAG: YcxB family protein [Candidatus Acidiferrales bacterium]
MPIHAEGQYSLADVWRGNRLNSWKLLTIYSVIGVLILPLAVLASLHDEAGWKDQWPLFAAGLFFLSWAWIVVFYRSYRLKTGSPNLKGLVRYEFDESGIQCTALHSQSEVRWPAILKWKEGEDTILMYHAPKLANIIPKRFFQSPGDVDALRNLLRTNVQPKKN